MIKNLLFLLLFIRVFYTNPIFDQLDKKFQITTQDNVIYIFQSKHKKDKVTPQEIKENALTVIKKLHQWKIPSIKIVQILHIKNLPRFVPQKLIRKKLLHKSKYFTQLIMPMMTKEERKTYNSIEFHWYIDKKAKFFNELSLNLTEPHLFLKAQGFELKKSSPTLLIKNDFVKTKPKSLF